MSNLRFPPKYQRIIDQVKEQDKQYFLNHPDQGMYNRPLVAGEFWPLKFDWAIVYVMKLDEKTRSRQILAFGERSVYRGRLAKQFLAEMERSER